MAVSALMKAGMIVQFGILRGQVVLVARNQSDLALGDKRNGAITVPLDFEQPFGVVERLFDRSGQHGVDRGGHGPFDRATKSLTTEDTEDTEEGFAVRDLGLRNC